MYINYAYVLYRPLFHVKDQPYYRQALVGQNLDLLLSGSVEKNRPFLRMRADP